jgi:NADH-quinone oxidoreductase subunit L
MRAMGGLRRELPVTFWTMMAGALALSAVGIPFTPIGFAGFVSKDPIIEAAFVSDRLGATYAFWCSDIAAGLTAFYTWRLMFMTFFGRRGDWSASLPSKSHDGHGPEDHGHDEHPVHESPPVMLIPLGVLAFGAAFAGMAFRYVFIGAGRADFWRSSLFLGQENEILERMERLPWLVSLSPTLFMLGGLGIAAYMYLVDRTAPKRLADTYPYLYRFLLNKWYFDELYDFVFVRPAFAIGRLFWKEGDGAIIDGFGPDGVSARVLDVTREAVRLQTGYIYHYAFAMLLGAAALATWYLFGGSL